MRDFAALAVDYDGTIATGGRVSPATLDALRALVASGRRALLVTGRQLDDLCAVCPGLDVFARVVAENGALLHDPSDATPTRTRVLAPPPPRAFVDRLRDAGVTPLSVGEVIVATLVPWEHAVREAIDALSLELDVVLNKHALMVLPRGVDKASGLRAALDDLGLSASEVVGVGDAENDRAFLATCGCSVAVANAIDSLRAQVDVVTRGEAGEGVIEIVRRILDGRIGPG